MFVPACHCLASRLTDNVKVETQLGHKLFSKVVLDPTQKEFVTLSPEAFTIREAQNEEAVWNALEQAVAVAKLVEPPLPFPNVITALISADISPCTSPSDASISILRFSRSCLY